MISRDSQVMKSLLITKEFAEILGLLCSEGSYCLSYSTYYGVDRGKRRLYKNKKSERIEFYNKDKVLLKHYQNLLAKEFDYYPSITKHGKVIICRRDIIRKILSFTKLGHLKWSVPNEINSFELMVAFVRGFFDGDGSFSSNKVRFFSTNKKGLDELSRILDKLGFDHTFQKPLILKRRKPCYFIHVKAKGRERFLQLINPVSKRPSMR